MWKIYLIDIVKYLRRCGRWQFVRLEQRDVAQIVLDHRLHDHLKDGLHVGRVSCGCEMRTNHSTGIVVALQEFLLYEQRRLVDILVGSYVEITKRSKTFFLY